MEKWHPSRVMDDAELVVSEIATNAVKAVNFAPMQAAHHVPQDHVQVICLCFYLLPDELLIELWDPPPISRSAGNPDPATSPGVGCSWSRRRPRTGGPAGR